jgi:hypothetical protein
MSTADWTSVRERAAVQIAAAFPDIGAESSRVAALLIWEPWLTESEIVKKAKAKARGWIRSGSRPCRVAAVKAQGLADATGDLYLVTPDGRVGRTTEMRGIHGTVCAPRCEARLAREKYHARNGIPRDKA